MAEKQVKVRAQRSVERATYQNYMEGGRGYVWQKRGRWEQDIDVYLMRRVQNRFRPGYAQGAFLPEYTLVWKPQLNRWRHPIMTRILTATRVINVPEPEAVTA